MRGFPSLFSFRHLTPFSLVLVSQIQALHIAAANATDAMNARGDTVVTRLQDVRNRVREIASHGVHRGATVAIAVVQTMSGADCRTFHPVFPVGEEPEDFYELVDDLSIVADAVVEEVSLDAVISNVFDDE